mmetsp:Transcript_8318/g.19521  ORF Transcript_8318/g.19521 Transcript_8318/m.19521 type:complete len:322 (+) Transcript_8318:660-1625(+)
MPVDTFALGLGAVSPRACMRWCCSIPARASAMFFSLVYGLSLQPSLIFCTESSAKTSLALSLSPDSQASFLTFESCLSWAKYTSAVFAMVYASGLYPTGRDTESDCFVLGGRGGSTTGGGGCTCGCCIWGGCHGTRFPAASRTIGTATSLPLASKNFCGGGGGACICCGGGGTAFGGALNCCCGGACGCCPTPILESSSGLGPDPAVRPACCSLVRASARFLCSAILSLHSSSSRLLSDCSRYASFAARLSPSSPPRDDRKSPLSQSGLSDWPRRDAVGRPAVVMDDVRTAPPAEGRVVAVKAPARSSRAARRRAARAHGR